jgi:soluble lytic murein transglycosylase-like protein
MNTLNIIKSSLILGLLLQSLSLAPPAWCGSEIYSYIDSEGVLNFTDRPLPSSGIPSARNRNYPTPAEPARAAKMVKIYKFIDANGIVHLTDRPNSSGYRLIYQGDNNQFSFSDGAYGYAKIHSKYKEYYALVDEVAKNNSLEPEFLHAVIQTESAYNPNATSPKGAVGLMQLMPGTARRYGVTDRTDIFSNLYGGARYLRYLLDLFGGNKELALAGYNAGENAVIRYGNEIPPYRETRNYVKRVMAIYRTHLNK